MQRHASMHLEKPESSSGQLLKLIRPDYVPALLLAIGWLNKDFMSCKPFSPPEHTSFLTSLSLAVSKENPNQ
uniref:Uncharacterized protein n=1 Tax=Arundo donax TaxID=35708 RepID=A0A0A9DBY4_ARUDO